MARAAVTQAVVLPNMLATITGRSWDSGAGRPATIPQMAPAARLSRRREMRLSPETSTMLGNMTMSRPPT